MTATQFQALILAWLAGITVLIPVVFGVVRLFLSEWRTLRQVTSDLQARTEAIDRVVNGGLPRKVRTTDTPLDSDKVGH